MDTRYAQKKKAIALLNIFAIQSIFLFRLDWQEGSFYALSRLLDHMQIHAIT